MEIFTSVLVGLCVLLCSYLLYKRKADYSDYPAGPTPLPVIGNLHQIILNGSIVKFLEKYRKIYGNVFTVELGGRKQVVVSTLPVMHELFVKSADVTSNRNAAILVDDAQEFARRTPGLIWAPYPHWKTIRSFALNVLRSEGMGKSAMEPKILDELQAYLQTFVERNLDKPFDMSDSLMMATSNVISGMVFGSRFEYSDPVFQQMLSDIRAIIDGTWKTVLTQCVPFARFLPDEVTGLSANTRLFDSFLPTIQKFVDEHKASLDRENPRDYIDQFLINMADQDTDEKNTPYTEGNLCVSVFHLFTAGTESTSTALRWALLYMCRCPDIQLRVQQEVDSVIGRDRFPSYKDHTHMPYTEAVLNEVLRIGNIAPTSVPHKVDRDIVIEGKTIPADATLMMNMFSVLSDENVFTKADEFNPERYLTDNQNLKTNTIPFGLGRRICLGESLARMEFFLFFTTMMQRYSVGGADGEELSTRTETKIVNAPMKYKIVFSHRK